MRTAQLPDKTVKVGDRLKALKTTWFADDTIENKGSIIVVTEQTLAYYQLFSSFYEKSNERS